MSWGSVDDVARGLDLLCDEHDAQYCLVAAAEKAMTGKLDPIVHDGLLSMVLLSAQTHSKAEERLMLLFDFPELETHSHSHDHLVDRAQTMLDAFRAGRHDLVDDLVAFADALNGHISEDDALFQHHLQQLFPDQSGSRYPI